MKKFITCLWLLFSPLSFGQTNTLDPTQVYTTGNIVVNTPQGGPSPWVNGVYQDSLTCWTWGNPGYCGPNAIVRPGNNINFSFGQTDLYQSRAIANILPNSGTGLRVNGYNFSFMAKNGNGWDDGRVDYLYAYTHFTNQNNQVVHYKTYNLTYNFDWTSFNYSETFNTPFASKDLKNVTYGFVGRDNNGWAGPYGPEIYNVSFSLKYSVDPCANNPLYSPTCPGYTEALAKLASAPTTATITEVATNTITTTPQPSTTTTTTTQSPVVETSSPATSSPSVALTSSGNNKETTVNSNGVTIGLSVVSRNAQREQAISMQAAQSAVAAAEQTAQQAQQEAVSVAQSSSANSVSFSSSPVAKQFQTVAKVEQTQQSVTSQSQNSSTVSSFQPNAQQTRSTENRSTSFSLLPEQAPVVATQSVPAITQVNNLIISQPVVSTPIISAEQPVSTQVSTSLSLLPPVPTQQIQTAFVPFTVQEVKENNQNVPTFSQSQTIFNNNDLQTSESQKLLTDKTNPINQIIESKPELQSSQTVQQKTTVNTNASDNEIAGGVGLARMATTPPGYAQYLNLMIADASFYAPKEIYRGQRTVDNVRALRAMSSDRLHQQMVDSQYERK